MRVLLVSNAEKEQVKESLTAVSQWLAAAGVEHDHIFSDHLLINDPLLAEWSRWVHGYDLVASFGGDGTILRVARMIGGSGVPLLAFNYGGMGFLASEQPSAVLGSMEAALSGAVTEDERAMAEVEVAYDDGSIEHQTALNEVVATRGNSGRIVSLELFINDTYMEKTRGDGVLVATASGSTAYALSAGGPLVDPHYAGLVVVPVSPHTLKSWSIVTGPDDVAVIKPSQDNSQRIVPFIDGEAIGPILAAPGADLGPEVLAVRVRIGTDRLRLLRPVAYDFYEQVALSFFGSAYE